jgi:hypothetical protein
MRRLVAIAGVSRICQCFRIRVRAAKTLCGVDLRTPQGMFGDMTVTLSREAESYVTEMMKRWRTAQPDEVASCLILKQRADDAYDREHPQMTEDQLVQELLAGVRAAHRPYEAGEFRRLAERLIGEQKAR